MSIVTSLYIFFHVSENEIGGGVVTSYQLSNKEGRGAKRGLNQRAIKLAITSGSTSHYLSFFLSQSTVDFLLLADLNTPLICHWLGKQIVPPLTHAIG